MISLTFLSAVSSSDMKTTGTSVCSSLDSSSRVQYLRNHKISNVTMVPVGRLIADMLGPGLTKSRSL